MLYKRKGTPSLDPALFRKPTAEYRGAPFWAWNCKLEQSELGYSKSMLGQYFNMDELGRIEKIELGRRSLARNDREVFLAAVAAIKKEKETATDASDPFADLRRKQEAAKKAKENKNT